MKAMTRLYWLRTEKSDLLKRIEDYNVKIEELTNLGSPPISDMPHGNGVGNPTEKYVTKLLNLKEKRQELIFKSLEIEEETESYIKMVDDPEIRTLMRKYYIDGMGWNEIARKYYRNNCDGSTPRKKVNNYLKERN